MCRVVGCGKPGLRMHQLVVIRTTIPVTKSLRHIGGACKQYRSAMFLLRATSHKRALPALVLSKLIGPLVHSLSDVYGTRAVATSGWTVDVPLSED